ncbi:MAG: hypothetical protein LBR38_07970 [Synergistaceae bacterium]|nr:hypothetical protein [Synergistaceae bacterium]
MSTFRVVGEFWHRRGGEAAQHVGRAVIAHSEIGLLKSRTLRKYTREFFSARTAVLDFLRKTLNRVRARARARERER